MSESMVERVAAATREAVAMDRGRSVSFEEMSHIVARAAIEAMREPPVEMLTAFAQIADEADLAGVKIEWCHPNTWRAMISAALT